MLRAGAPLQGVVRWSTTIPGFAAHAGRIHAPSNSLLVADGWGVSFAGLRFRRLDLATGAEIASIRTGTQIRCFAVLPGDLELIGATDSKLYRLGLAQLDERQRWDRRIPRYSDSIVVRDGFALVANWSGTRVAIVDLAGGGVRRRDAPHMPFVIDAPSGPVLVGGSRDGGWASLNLHTATVQPIRSAPPAIDAAVSRDGTELWSTVGVRGTYTIHGSGATVAPADPSRRLRREWLDDREPAAEFALPVPVSSLVIGTSALWLASERSLVALPLPITSAPARVWTVSRDQSIAWFDPDAGMAIVVTGRISPDAATITAFALD